MSANTTPPGPRTGFAHPYCYAAGLNDCSAEANREHPISRSLLAAYGESLVVDGLPWADLRPSHPSDLKSHILCKRHNTALSPLDLMITRLHAPLEAHRFHQPIGWHTIDGEDLERWAIKASIGMAASRNFLNLDRSILDPGPVPPYWLRYVFGDEELLPGCGLYVTERADVEASRLSRDALMLAISPAVATGGTLFGVSAHMVGITFVVSMVTRPPREIRGIYRPIGIRLGNGCVRLRWQGAHSDAVVEPRW
jgi:hypothetical protein